MKRSQIQQMVDKVNAEIAELERFKERLEALTATQPKLKRERKVKPQKFGAGILQDGSMPERMRG